MISLTDVVLKLDAPGAQNNTQVCGEITVRFWTEETAEASAPAIVNAHKVVNKLEGGNAATRSLEAVVSKLKVFVEIADEAAKVYYIPLSRIYKLIWLGVKIHPYVNLVWQATSSVYKV
jgi:hypothetical protein